MMRGPQNGLGDGGRQELVLRLESELFKSPQERLRQQVDLGEVDVERLQEVLDGRCWGSHIERSLCWDGVSAGGRVMLAVSGC